MNNINIKNKLELIKRAYSPYTEWPLLKKNFFKLPDYYSFDLEKLRSQVNEILKVNDLAPYTKRIGSRTGRFNSYRGINFTCREDSKIPLYDGLNTYDKLGFLDHSKLFSISDPSFTPINNVSEIEFVKKTKIYNGYVSSILSKFNSTITKVRLIELKSKSKLPEHFDFPYYKIVRVHSVIWSNPDCYWVVDGERFVLPSDGSFYWIDAGKIHSAHNEGTSNRLILSVNLSVYFDRSGLQKYGPEKDMHLLANELKL